MPGPDMPRSATRRAVSANVSRLLPAIALAAALAACTGGPQSRTTPGRASLEHGIPAMTEPARQTEHRGQDDLLTAGLGLDGLRAMAPPAFADAAHPTAAELRRRAIWSSWRGIADLSPGGGYGSLYGSVASVPGREYSALARLPGARQPHRVLVQVPDAFDPGRRCVVVAPSSGSRGIYGAIAVAGPWALPKGCAVAYTDKGTGSDYVDLDAGIGVREDGTPGGLDEAGDLAFAPEVPAGAGGVAFKHAHSQDNPEADWGLHVKQAAEFALVALERAFPQAAPFTFDNTRIIAAGISNGGGAVLRAAELDGDWLDAVVAGEPNVYVEGHGSRPLYDFGTEAALLMPCALLHLPAETLPQPPLRAQVEPLWQARCATAAAAGLVEGGDAAAQARSAYERMRASGWTDAALQAGTLSVGFDLWRAVVAMPRPTAATASASIPAASPSPRRIRTSVRARRPQPSAACGGATHPAFRRAMAWAWSIRSWRRRTSPCRACSACAGCTRGRAPRRRGCARASTPRGHRCRARACRCWWCTAPTMA